MVRFTYVYRLFDAIGTLLYVGTTRDLNRRLAEHERDRGEEWSAVANMAVTTFTSYFDAMDCERTAIAEFNPPWNVARYRITPRTSAPKRLASLPSAPIPLESAEQRRDRVGATLAEMGGWRRTGEVAEHMGRSPALVRKRLNELVDRGLVERYGDNRTTRYRTVPNPAEQTRERIYRVICQTGGARTGEIARAVGRCDVLIRKRAQELIAEGRVTREGDGPATRYVPA